MYFVEESREGLFLLIEKGGAFYNHGFQDVPIATFKNETKAQEVCDMLNEKYENLQSEGMI